MTQKQKPKAVENKDKSVLITLTEEGTILVNSETMTVYEVLGVLHGAINIINNPQPQTAPAAKKKAGRK